MSVDQKLAQPAASPESVPTPNGTATPFEALNRAVAAFLARPDAADREAAVVKAIEPIARLSGGAQKLRETRVWQKQQSGAYTLRYVCTRVILEDGTVEALQRPRPARDRMLVEFQRRIKSLPDQFPGGLAAFLQDVKPIYTADTQKFARLAQHRIQEHLRSLPGLDSAQLPSRLADLLDLLFAYRHSFLQNAQASPTALKIIDAGDVESMVQFLITAASKAPFTEAEFSRFIRAEVGPSSADVDDEAILRGRIVNSGLKDTPGVMQRWIKPFLRELSFRGQIPDLERKYQSRRSSTANPARPSPTSQQSASASSSQPTVPAPPPPAPIEAPLPADSNIPIGATEPLRLKILKDYLGIVPIGRIILLEEAMQMAVADPKVDGHRQYVVRTFRQAGWTVIPRGNRDPIFEKRPDPRSPANVPKGGNTP